MGLGVSPILGETAYKTVLTASATPTSRNSVICVFLKDWLRQVFLAPDGQGGF
jgi:hypothetical protein